MINRETGWGDEAAWVCCTGAADTAEMNERQNTVLHMASEELKSHQKLKIQQPAVSSKLIKQMQMQQRTKKTFGFSLFTVCSPDPADEERLVPLDGSGWRQREQTGFYPRRTRRPLRVFDSVMNSDSNLVNDC